MPGNYLCKQSATSSANCSFANDACYVFEHWWWAYLAETGGGHTWQYWQQGTAAFFSGARVGILAVTPV